MNPGDRHIKAKCKGTRRWALFATAALLAASCTANDSDGGGGSADPKEPAARASGEVDGCEDGWTDPSDLGEDRTPARCDSGAPAPDPLEERKKIVVTSSTLNAEYIAVLRYGVETGEFDKENLAVEFKAVPPADAYPLLGAGEIDATWSAPDAAFMNAVISGFDLRWVIANFSVPPESKTGLWVERSGDGTTPLADLKGSPIGTIVGKGSVIAYPINEALKADGLSLADFDFQTLPAADIVAALENGGLRAAWVLDPLWVQLIDSEKVKFVQGQPPGEPLGGLIMGPNLLRDDPDAGVAFVRAYMRTQNTYFADNYKEGSELLGEVASILELPEELLSATPDPVWDWEIREGTTDRLQEAYLAGKVLNADEALDEDKLVDRSLYETAVGHSAD